MGYTSRIPRFVRGLDNAIEKGLEDLAGDIVHDAKARAPVATGSLRAAIHAENVDEGVAVVAGDDDVFYGHLVEFGTSQTGARPFLIPAMEGKRANVRTRAAVWLKGLL